MVDTAIKGGVDPLRPRRRSLPRSENIQERYRLFSRCDIYGLGSSDAGDRLEQRRARLGIDRFDFFMLTYLNEATADFAYDEERQLMALEEKRRQGAVGHVGVYFSGGFKALKAFLDKYREFWEFLQHPAQLHGLVTAARGKRPEYSGTSAFLS